MTKRRIEPKRKEEMEGGHFPLSKNLKRLVANSGTSSISSPVPMINLIIHDSRKRGESRCIGT